MVLDGCIVDTNKANCDPIVFMSFLRTVCVEVVEQQAAILNPLYLLEKHSSWYAIQKKYRVESWSFEGFFYLIHQIARFPAFWNLNDTFKSVLLQKGLESLGVNTSWKMFIWINTSWNVSCPDSKPSPLRSLAPFSLSPMAAIEATLDWDLLDHIELHGICLSNQMLS